MTAPTPDLEAIKARADAATTGPWEITDLRRKLRGANGQVVLGIAALLWPDAADEEFLKNAREDTLTLLAALAAVTAERDAARSSSARWCETVAEVERALDDHAFDDEDGNGFVPIGPIQDALNGMAGR